MTGGFGMSAGRVSLLAAASLALLGSVSAQAADLGGDCCADLEERIAGSKPRRLAKATGKLNSKLGHVNEAVLYWDDSFEDNVYVVTNDAARTRFRFKGDAKINNDFKAGYLLEVGVRGGNSSASRRTTQPERPGSMSVTRSGTSTARPSAASGSVLPAARAKASPKSTLPARATSRNTRTPKIWAADLPFVWPMAPSLAEAP